MKYIQSALFILFALWFFFNGEKTIDTWVKNEQNKVIAEGFAFISNRDKAGGLNQLLCECIVKNDIDCVKKSLKYDANINWMDGEPLFKAIEHSNTRMVQFLLEKGADINIKKNEVPPIIFAAGLKNYGIVKLLLQQRANINDRTIKGMTALMISILAEDYPTVDLLIKKGADLSIENDFYQTAFLLAKGQGNQSIINRIIEAGGDYE